MLLVLLSHASSANIPSSSGASSSGGSSGGSGVGTIFSPTSALCKAFAPSARSKSREHYVADFLGVNDKRLLPLGHGNIEAVQLHALLEDVAAEFVELVADPVQYLADHPKPRTDAHGLPMLIHVTLHDKHSFDWHEVLTIVSWVKANPGYALLMYDDTDVATYMQRYSPELRPLFDSLRGPVEKADLWRYQVLCKHGGVYTDMDTVATKPIKQWDLQGASLAVGIDNVYTRKAGGAAGGAGEGNRFNNGGAGPFVDFAQWTVAAKPGHDAVCKCGGIVQRRVQQWQPAGPGQADNAILYRTGPHAFSECMATWLGDRDVRGQDVVAGAKVRDVVILPQTRLSCNTWTFNPDETAHSYSYHNYRNSWKEPSSGGKRARRNIISTHAGTARRSRTQHRRASDRR